MDDFWIKILGTMGYERLYMHLILTLLCWLVTLIAVFLDMWDGVKTAKVLRQKVSSKGLRKTVTKYSDYWRLLLFGLLFDLLGCFFSWYLYPYITIVITVAVLFIEFKSLIEHAQRRKDATAEIPDIISSIINCVKEQDAEAILRKINSRRQQHGSDEKTQ